MSILAIIDSAHFAKAGLSSTPRETLAPADTAIATNEATQETEEQIGLTKAKRRKVQRRLTRLGFERRSMGNSTNRLARSSRAGRRSHGYPATGFLNAAQHKALTDAAKEAGNSDHKDRRRAGGHTRYSRGVGGPIGAIGRRGAQALVGEGGVGGPYYRR